VWSCGGPIEGSAPRRPRRRSSAGRRSPSAPRSAPWCALDLAAELRGTLPQPPSRYTHAMHDAAPPSPSRSRLAVAWVATLLAAPVLVQGITRVLSSWTGEHHPALLVTVSAAAPA